MDEHYSNAATLLSMEQIEQFNRCGYIVLKNMIAPPILRRLHDASERWTRDAFAMLAAESTTSDYAFLSNNDIPHLIRINGLHTKGDCITLELLGSPTLLGIAISLCGKNIITGYESMMVKQEHDKQLVPWHQDAVYDRKYRVITLGIYLDDSRINGGCLNVLPGTQHEKQDICAIAESYGYNAPDIHRVEAQAGDIVVHDAMVVHSSSPVEIPTKRRTIYFEFRSVEEQIEEGYQSRVWIDKRIRLQELAQEYYQSLSTNDAALDDALLQEELQHLTNRTASKPGNFCFEFSNMMMH